MFSLSRRHYATLDSNENTIEAVKPEMEIQSLGSSAVPQAAAGLVLTRRD